MSIQEKLVEAGFKPEVSTEGEWQPYKGVYLCKIVTLRPEFDEKNSAHFVQVEYDISEVLTGDMKRESKYPAFRKRYYLDWDNPEDSHLENVKSLSNDIFTATGKEMDWTDKAQFSASAESLIGQDVYLRAWGWTPDKDIKGNPLADDQKRTIQQFKVMKKEVAEKRRTADSVAF